MSSETAAPPSEETPVYGKVQHQAGRLFMITCNEGWRSTILCDSMYEDDADWLLVVLGRQPRRIEPEDQAAAIRGQLKQLVITLRRISDQQATSGHAEGAYATGCAATMVEAAIGQPPAGIEAR